jgi:hypothetical protein
MFKFLKKRHWKNVYCTNMGHVDVTNQPFLFFLPNYTTKKEFYVFIDIDSEYKEYKCYGKTFNNKFDFDIRVLIDKRPEVKDVVEKYNLSI